MAWFVVRDAFGEVLEVTPCATSTAEQERRMTRAVHAWQQRGDRARKLDQLKYQMTSFDGNVRVLSIEEHRPAFRRDGPLKSAGPSMDQATGHGTDPSRSDPGRAPFWYARGPRSA